MEYNIAVVRGDGIGPEVISEAIKVLNAVGEKYGHTFHYEYVLAGGEAIDETGRCLPDETVAIAKASDAVLLGAVGGPKWDTLPGDERPERALLGLRKELGLFANLRPAMVFDELADASPLKPEIIAGGLDKTSFLVATIAPTIAYAVFILAAARHTHAFRRHTAVTGIADGDTLPICHIIPNVILTRVPRRAIRERTVAGTELGTVKFDTQITRCVAVTIDRAVHAQAATRILNTDMDIPFRIDRLGMRPGKTVPASIAVVGRFTDTRANPAIRWAKRKTIPIHTFAVSNYLHAN